MIIKNNEIQKYKNYIYSLNKIELKNNFYHICKNMKFYLYPINNFKQIFNLNLFSEDYEFNIVNDCIFTTTDILLSYKPDENIQFPFKTYYRYNTDFKTYNDVDLYLNQPIIYNKLFDNSNEHITINDILNFIKNYYTDYILTFIPISDNYFQLTMVNEECVINNWKNIIQKLGWFIISEEKIENIIRLDIKNKF